MSTTQMLARPRQLATWPWATLFGFAVVAAYLLFTLIALLLYPRPVSPITTYLSMLGNADLSPRGWVFYDAAVILTGLCEFPFFFAVHLAYPLPRLRWLWPIALLAGLVNALAVVMSGINAQHVNMDAHVAWSFVIFYSLLALMLAFSISFWTMGEATRRIGAYGFALCVIDIVFLAIMLGGNTGEGIAPLMEWVSVFSYMGWFVLVALDVRRRQQRGLTTAVK